MKTNIKYVFFGSPEFAKIIIEKLIAAGYTPAAVVCNPDEPVGRKKIITPPPIKQSITNNNWLIKIFQPHKLSGIKDKLAEIKADFFIVAAYAKIIPKDIIELPKLKTIGIHPSLLPKYRGASPIQSAILNGEKQTGVTIFMIDEKVDHGPMLTEVECAIEDNENHLALEKKLAEFGAAELIKILPEFIAGKIEPIIQDESAATYTEKFSTEDGRVNLKNDSAEIIMKKVRALNPDPGVFAFVESNGKNIRLKILETEIRNGKLEIIKVQPEGKKPMGYREFLAGNKIA